MQLLNNQALNIEDSDIIAFSCVRNELLRLPYFLEYHRTLGVNRFVFIDNASTDETADFLLSQDDIFVYSTTESYASSKCGINWLNQLLLEFGTGHWTLTLDADELLIYPMCENIGLHRLVEYLDSVDAQAVATFMLDMYADKAIKDTVYTSGEPFQDTCNYFDSDTYVDFDKLGLPVRGGPRHRLFWEGQDRPRPSPVLRKVPLVKWRENLQFEASTHAISGLTLASLTGIIQHFKFFSDFIKYSESESKRKEHWDDAAQYESYWSVLYKTPDLNPMYAGSLAYKDSMQLVELGMMRLPDSFINFARKHEQTQESI